MPAITSLWPKSVFVDEVATCRERTLSGWSVPHGADRSACHDEGIKSRPVVTILWSMIALPFVFIAGAGFIASCRNELLLAREYSSGGDAVVSQAPPKPRRCASRSGNVFTRVVIGR